MPGLPWRLLRAQLAAESALDPNARSPVGAEGIAQMMPNTWREISEALGYSGVPRSAAGPAINGAAYYMARLRDAWSVAVDWDKHRLSVASYNAGRGNISKARRRCADSVVWAEVARCLPDVTGRHSTETIGYVDRIWRLWMRMEQAR